MARTAMARRKKRTNFISYLLIAVIVFLIGVVVLIQSGHVRAKLESYRAKEADLDAKIVVENARTEEIKELEKYVQTKAYAQEQAQEKLGLVKEGEIIFRKE